ncbi:hypothetical protein O3P69_017012 [Scylla paramamosain]|uniref:peptidylprolyl isomerase n=1 Tax=Scylla paramamosain TaxID=85552 RepID=A0AAW0TU60_SCYPA
MARARPGRGRGSVVLKVDDLLPSGYVGTPYLPPGQQRQTDFSTVFHSAKGGLIGPLFRHDGGYQLDSPNPDGGCYYQFKHYDEGDRITTNESCLNCTCHSSMLMCYLKVCPTVKTFGKNCTMEKKPNQCCPVITCPQVPVQLQIMQMTTTPPFPTSTGLMPSTEYGCTIDGFYYPDGVQVPSEPDKPCELCYCIRNHTACVMQECILMVPGCKPVFKEGVCCPVRYNCAHDEIEAVPTTTTLPLESNETTVLPTTTMLPESSGCIHKGEFYADGALIPSDDPCEHCYCMMGNPVCAVQECQSPLDEMQDNCIPQLPPPGKCCPEAYDCPEVLTTVSPSEDTTVTIDALPSTDTTLLQTSKTAESTEETTKTTPFTSVQTTDSPLDTEGATDSSEETEGTTDSSGETDGTADSVVDTIDSNDSLTTTDSSTLTKETTPHIYIEPSEVTTVTPAVTSDTTYKPKPSIEVTDSPIDTGVTTDSSDTTVTADSSDAGVATDSPVDTSDTSDFAGATGVTTDSSDTGVTTDSTTVTKETTPHIYIEPSEVTTTAPLVTSDATYKPKPSIEVTDSSVDTDYTTDSSDTGVTTDSSDDGVATDSPVDTSDSSDSAGATGVITDSITETKETTPHIYTEPSEVTTVAPAVTSDTTYKPKPSIEVTDSPIDTGVTTDSSDTTVTADSSDAGMATDSPVDTSDSSDSAGVASVTTDSSDTGVTTDSTTETKKTTPHIYTEPSEVTTVAPAVTSDTTYKPKPSIEPTDVDVIIDSSDSGVITDSSESGVTTDSTTVTKETTPHIYIEPSEVTTSAPSVTSDATYKPEPSTESTDSLVDTDYTTDSSDISVTTDYTEESIDTSVYPETDDKTADYPTATSETTISSTITKETTPHTVDETSIFTTDTPFGTSAVTATSSASTVTSETTDYSEADSNITDSAPDIGGTTDDPSETTEGPKVTEESTVHSYTDLTETTTPASTSVSGRPIVFPGSCSISGTYVPSNSEVSPFGPCQESCLCLDGQVKCNMTACPSPPPAFLRCSPKPPSETECCPTYSCPTVDSEVTELSACEKNGELYMDGEDVPSSDPCDLCFCLRGDIVCAQQECNMPEGTNCVPVEGSSDSCCPTKYNCDVPDMTTTPAEDSSTFPSDTEETITEVPGTMLTGPETSFETRTTLSAESSTITTPIAPSSDPETSPSQPSATLGPEVTELPACEKNGEVYMDGEDVPSSDPCDLCSCWSGEIICAHRECEVPEDQNCVPVDDPSDSCCPTKYNCDVPDMTTTPAEDSSDTEETITEVPGTMLTGPETSFETRTTLPGESSTITTPIASSSDPETSTSPSQPSATFGPEVTELPACEKNGEVYMDGEDVPSSDPYPSDSCCPTKYNCESTFPSEPVETTTEVSDAMLTQPVTSTHAPSYTVKTSPSSAETGKTTESPEHEYTTESTPEFSETTDSLSVTQETTTHTVTEPSEVTTSAPAFTSGATYKPDPPTEATDPPIDADVIIDSSDVGVTTDSTTETKETTPHIYIEPSEVTTVAPVVTSDATYKPKPSIEVTDSPIDTGVTTDSSDTTVTTDSTTVTEETTPHTYIDTSDSAGATGVTTTTVTKETTPHIYIEPSEVTTVAPHVTSDATYKPKPSIEVTDSPIDSSDAGVATDSSVDTSDSSDSAGATGVTTDSSDTGMTTDSTTVTKETTPHIYIEPSEVTTTAPLVTSDATYKPKPSTEVTDSSVDTDYTTDSSDTGVTTDSLDGGVATDSPVDTSDSAGATGVTTTTVTKETTPHIYIEPSEVTTVAPHVTNDVTYKPKPSIEATDSPVDTSDTSDSAGATGVTTDSSDDVLTTDSLVDTDYPTDSSDIDSPVDPDVTTVSPSVISEGTDHSVDKDETTTTEMTPGQTDTATNTEGIPANMCLVNGEEYADGDVVPSKNICSDCYCYQGELICATIDCPPPPASNCRYETTPPEMTAISVSSEEIDNLTLIPSNETDDTTTYDTTTMGYPTVVPTKQTYDTTIATKVTYETTHISAGTDDTTTVAPEGTNDTVTIDPEATNDTVTDVPGDTDHTTDDTVTIGPEDADKTTNDYFTVGPEEPGTVTPATGEISESTTAQTASTDKEDFTGCIVEDQQYEDGSSMPLTSDCQKSCRCDNGSVICSRLSCPPQPPAFLRCSTLPANSTCCPVYDCPIFPEDTSTAAPACVEDGVTYLNGEYIPKDSECVDCYCLSGRIVCASLECAAPAPDCITLTHPAGSCCPTQYECFEHPTTDTEVATDTVTTDEITIPVTSTTTSASSVEASTATVSPVVIEAMSSLTTEESEVSAGVVTTETSLASIDTTTPAVSSSTTSETPISTTESKEDVSEGTVISASPSLGSSEQSDSDEKEEGTSAVTQPLPPSTSSSSSASTDSSPFPSFPTSSNTTHTPMEYDPEACMFNGKVFASAQQIPRDDPCDFCFCFRGDIICLQQTCPPPISNCFEEAIAGYCCPRFQCPVVQTLVNVTTTTTPIPTYPPIQQEVEMIMCEIGQRYYQHGQIVREASGPCLVCRCGRDGMMDCIPQECKAEPMLRRILSSKYGWKEGNNMAAKDRTEGGIREFLAHEMMGPPIQLTEALNIRDLSNESGTLFEVAAEPSEDHHPPLQQSNFFDDISLISSLSLGGGMFDEDESKLSDAGDEEPFEQLACRMVDISGDGGVLKMEVKAGVGESIPDGASVTFHYNAFLEHNDEPFDSTLLRGRPERKLLDDGGLLPGLNLAIKTMRCSETSRFLIWPQYAFGEKGCPPRIPGGEVLLYEIQLVSAVDRAAADSFEDLEGEKQNITSFKEKLKAAQAHHRQGNQHHREGNLHGAKNSYCRAAWILEYCALKDREEELERGNILVRLRSNLAQVYLELKDPARACTQCRMGLSVTGEHSQEIIAKLNFRLGKAKGLLNDFSGAKKFLLQAQRLKPGRDEITEELEAVIKREEKWAARERFMCQQMFNSTATAERQGQASGKASKWSLQTQLESLRQLCKMYISHGKIISLERSIVTI